MATRNQKLSWQKRGRDEWHARVSPTESWVIIEGVAGPQMKRAYILEHRSGRTTAGYGSHWTLGSAKKAAERHRDTNPRRRNQAETVLPGELEPRDEYEEEEYRPGSPREATQHALATHVASSGYDEFRRNPKRKPKRTKKATARKHRGKRMKQVTTTTTKKTVTTTVNPDELKRRVMR